MSVDAETRLPVIAFAGSALATLQEASQILMVVGVPHEAVMAVTAEQLTEIFRTTAPSLVIASRFEKASQTAIEVRRTGPWDVPILSVLPLMTKRTAAESVVEDGDHAVGMDQLWMLVPIVKQALELTRRAAVTAQQRSEIMHLRRGLQLMRGVNVLVLEHRDRAQLLVNACRLMVTTGGYSVAVALSRMPEMTALQPVAWSGIDSKVTESLRLYVAQSSMRETSAIGHVMKTGQALVCNNTADFKSTAQFDAILNHSGFKSVVVLPLLSESIAVGLLVLVARSKGKIGREELGMLQEVAGSLSHAIEQMRKDVKVRFLSNFDPQTGLARRPLFSERLTRLLTGSEVGGRRIAVVIVDVERLSLINDSFGRSVGDQLILQIGDRLKAYVKEPARIGHFGAGTFALITEQGTRSEDEMLAAAQRLAAVVFDVPFEIAGVQVPVAVRTGFALYPNDGNLAAVLIQKAEAALRSARALAQRHSRFDEHTQSKQEDALALTNRLRGALERNAFEVHYQPKVNVITRRMEGVEALLRWRDGERGLISAAEFVPLLESSGLIASVGAWAVQQAARDCRSWKRAGLPPIRVAVNVSPMQLRDDQFLASFLEALSPWSSRQWGLDIEVTEGFAQQEAPSDLRKLEILRAKGCRVALDDFGTGFSSLSRLAALPVDTLKIDKSFVSQLGNSVTGRAMVQTIIDIGRTFGMTSVAEGVETQQQLDILWQMGCDQSQGYLHSKAVTSAEMVKLLQAGDEGRLLPPEAVSA